MKTAPFFAIVGALCYTLSAAQEVEVSWKSTELVPGLHMLEGQNGFPGGNLGLLTGDDGIVLIDSGLPDTSAMTVATIERMTEGPINFVITTHAHGDHTGALNVYRGENATIFAHDNLRRTLVADDRFDQSGLPQVTFSDSVTFHLNGHSAFVFFLPNAHTDGDSAIHFPDANVIHAGDVFFNGGFPYIDLTNGGSVDGYIAGMQKIVSMANDDTQIIPGHGSLADRAALQASIDMLIDARAQVMTLISAGDSLQEVLAKNPLAAHKSWDGGFISTESLTETIYRSLTATP